MRKKVYKLNHMELQAGLDFEAGKADLAKQKNGNVRMSKQSYRTHLSNIANHRSSSLSSTLRR